MHTRIYADTLLYNLEAYQRWQSLPGDHIAPQLYIDGHRHPGWYYQWEDSIVPRMNIPATVTISMTGSFDPGNGQGFITATYRNDSTAAIQGRVMFVIVEDSIYFMDSLAGQMKEWHNHTARDYIPGPLGIMLTIAPGDSVTYTQPFSIPSTWRYNYCSIITFIQDTIIRPDTVTQNIWQGAMMQVSTLIGAAEENKKCFDVRLPATLFSKSLLFPDIQHYRIFDIAGREILISDPSPGVYFLETAGEIRCKIIKIK